MQSKLFITIASRMVPALLCCAGLGALSACGGDDGEAGDAGAGFITISEIGPDHGPQSGGNVVSIIGTGFTLPGVERNQVLVGDALATAVSVISDSTIEVIMPAGLEAGPIGITVFNGNGSASLGDIYSYNERPTIASLTPEDGNYLGGEAITISGSGFQNLEPGENLVFFSDVPATEVSVVDDSTITAVTPAGSLFGATEVELQNDNGSSSPEIFRYTGNGLLAFGHSRRDGGGFPGATPVSGNEGEVFQIDPISKTIESTGATITTTDSNPIPICRAVAHDGTNVYARTHDGGLLQFGFDDPAANTISPIEGCSRVHGLATHQGALYGYCRNNSSGQSFGRIDTVAKVFVAIGNTNGGNRINLLSDGTTLYLRTDSQISTINPNTGVRGAVVQILSNDSFSIRGMAFSDGILYFVSTAFGGLDPDLTFLQSLDPNSGQTDFVMTLGSGLRGLVTTR